MAATKPKQSSKHDEPIKIDAPPAAVVRSLFNGKPKPKNKWRYLQENGSVKRSVAG